MDAIQNDKIEQYKQYFKRMNIEQYGYSVLLSALNEGRKNDGFEALDGQEQSEDDSLTTFAPYDVKINTDNVLKKMWKDLEQEIKQYEKSHPEIKGQYIVAINAQGADNMPAVTVSSKEEVLALIPEAEREESAKLIDLNPVQIFRNETLDVRALPSAGLPGLDALIQGFLEKNRGVFQYLQNASGAAGTAGA